MAVKLSPRAPRLPMFLRGLHTDEYPTVAPTERDLRVNAKVRDAGPKSAKRISMTLADYWSGRQGTAAGLRAVDEAAGGGFYNIPKEAELDKAAADDALGGTQLIIDAQTHYISEKANYKEWNRLMIGTADSVMADRFKGVQKLVFNQNELGYSMAEYLRCVFLESETAVAVLTSAPGVEGTADKRSEIMRMLTNAEIYGTQELLDRLAGTGRILSHSIVHPNIEGQIDMMDRWKDWCSPAGWKVYTLYGSTGEGPFRWGEKSWLLDDEQIGVPFLERARDVGVPVICAHKGISAGCATGWDGPSSPKDVGPVAKAFPDIKFLIYHSGYETREGDLEEGPYKEEEYGLGTNRLVKSLRDAKIGPGSNVYGEMGTTWYQLMAHPVEAAHVLGKLLSALGEDNLIWGTDCIFYGPSQPMIDAFRAFQIPQEFSDRYGYPQLTPKVKEKILGLNAARIYGLDPDEIRAKVRNDDLAWVKEAMNEFSISGTPSAI